MRSGALEGCVMTITRPVLLQAAPAPRVPPFDPSGAGEELCSSRQNYEQHVPHWSPWPCMWLVVSKRGPRLYASHPHCMLCKCLKHAAQKCQSCLVCMTLLASGNLSFACMPLLHTCRQRRCKHLESFQFCKPVKVPRLVTYGAGMPGTAVLLQSSDKDLKSCTWTYREKKVKLSATCLPAGHVAYSA